MKNCPQLKANNASTNNPDCDSGPSKPIAYPIAADRDDEPVFIQENSSVQNHQDLRVYQRAAALRRDIFELTKGFPRAETYGLTTQVRNSSRSVTGGIAEAWRRRRYPASFVNKLSEAEAEAAETQTWVECAAECGYISEADRVRLCQEYDALIRSLVGMQMHVESWTRAPSQPKPKQT